MLLFLRLLLALSCISRLTTAQTTTAPPITTSSTAPPTTTTTSSGISSASTPPDVYLNVPKLHVGRIELDVDNLSADINLAANVAQLVTINAGVQVSIQKVNLTITDVDAELELIVRLGHLVDIVNRVFSSIDLNPIIITALNNVTSLLGEVVGAVDGLLGSVTRDGSTLSFIVDNLGNIVQQVAGAAGGGIVSTIVGDFQTNMTFTGQQKTLQNGLVQKTYSYSPLNALVDIVFNAAGQVVQATVEKKGSTTTTSSGASSTAAPTATAKK